jgi:hypothetical protein
MIVLSGLLSNNFMEQNKSKTGWVVAVIVIVVLIIIAVMMSNNGTDEYANNGNQPTPTVTATPTVDNSNTGVEVGAGAGAPGITYSEALVAYASRRVQFSHPQGLNSCNATPQKVTFKGGTKFMLDNRMNNTATIHFSSGVNYTLPAYGFQIVTLNTPNTYNIDCNSTQNVATVVIQK